MRRESGQAAVESALILPVFVFLILGILQLFLMHQARLVTKYAAYKAVRAGAMNNAKIATMEKAALAVLLPLVGERSGGAGAEKVVPVDGAGAFVEKWSKFQVNSMSEGGLKHVAVTICGPTQKELGGKNSGELSFDDPAIAAATQGSDWKKAENTKLRIQLTFNYRMPIPFANWMIHQIINNQQTPSVLMLGKKATSFTPQSAQYKLAASMGAYVLPIRATYTMRMQSNIYLSKAPIPAANECIFPWSKK